MLNSAAGVTLPSARDAPPMITSSPSRAAMSGALTSASRDVGQRPQRAPGDAVRRRAAHRLDQEVDPVLGPQRQRRHRAAAAAEPAVAMRDDRAATSVARQRPRGTRHRPACRAGPPARTDRRALRSVTASGRLPATATSPSDLQLRRRPAPAGSRPRRRCPGSVSMMIARGMARPSSPHGCAAASAARPSRATTLDLVREPK